MKEENDNIVPHPAAKKLAEREKRKREVEDEHALWHLPNELDKLADLIRSLTMDEGMELREDESLGKDIRQLGKLAKIVRRRIRKNMMSRYKEMPEVQ